MVSWQGSAAGGRKEVRIGRVERTGGAAAQSGTAANGYIVARRRAALSTDVQGRIVELPVEEGEHVRTGDLIARLDTTQLEATLARARADRENAKAAANLARSELVRARGLVAERVAAPAELDRAEAALARAEATTLALDAAIHEVQILIGKSTVRAPFDGVIVQKNAEIGEVVSAGGAGPLSRGAVATLVDFASLEVQVDLAQTSLGAARTEAPVLVFLDAFPEKPYRGRVRQIWPTADRQRATVEVRIELLERDDRIRPEMGVRVVFVPGEGSGEAVPVEVTVPVPAVVAGKEPFVFVFTPSGEAPGLGTLTRRPVRLGKEVAGRVRVVGGLEGNEAVVLGPAPDLIDGERVFLRKEDRS